ncbi:MAG: hypothetical protein V3R31_03850 [Candidatus Humimicrobiaceae bacterium]
MTTKLINLLPKEEKKRDIRSIVINVFMVLVLILFLATILLTFFLFDIDNLLSSRLSDYEGTNIKVQDQVNKLKVYNDFKNNVDKKSDVLVNLKENELHWSRALYEIGKIMPEDAYLISFEAQGSQLYKYIEEFKEGESEEGKEVISFNVFGQAANYMDVLKLSIELKKIDNIKIVWIESITRTVIPVIDLEVVSFSINTYWDLDYFIEGIVGRDDSQDEGILDEEISDI